MLEILVVPACFIAAALVGQRLGTPPRVVGGLIAVGAGHALAFLCAAEAVRVTGTAAASLHLVSQWLFLAGFVALVWLAAAYPAAVPDRRLVAIAGALAFAGPLIAALSAPTPSVIGEGELGPVAHLFPAVLGQVAAVPLLLLPLLALTTFALRYAGSQAQRPLMRWPAAGFLLLVVIVGLGVAAGDGGRLTTVAFLVAAPILPLALAFGPVVHRLELLTHEVDAMRARVSAHARPAVPRGALARLTPRELTVIEEMARGKANPVIARSLHLSLSSVEKHATSIFRKLEVGEGPEVHRRVAAVVAYRDALASDDQGP